MQVLVIAMGAVYPPVDQRYWSGFVDIQTYSGVIMRLTPEQYFDLQRVEDDLEEWLGYGLDYSTEVVPGVIQQNFGAWVDDRHTRDPHFDKSFMR